MDALPEVIVIAGSNVSVYDANNGNIISTYKESRIAPRTLSLIRDDFLIGALITEPKIRVWTIGKFMDAKISLTGEYVCRGHVQVLTVTNCGTYAVGAIKDEIHTWRISTGELLSITNRHYQDVTCLRFSSDDSHLISGGKDGLVIVWILSQIIGVHIERDQIQARYVWNHHASEVTDIYPGSLGCVARLASTSIDMTCKIYEIDSGILLSTICMDVPLTAVVMDSMEYYLFLGASNGFIYKISTYEKLPREIHFSDMKNIEFKAHDQKITSLSISFDGEKLMSASADKSCRLWSTASMACQINIPLEGGITNAFLALKPTALPADSVQPFSVIRNFRREFDSPSKKGIRKFTDSKKESNAVTLKNLGSQDPFYNKVLCGSVKVVSELSKPEQKYYEDIYQESLNSKSIEELKEVNNQMYSYLINHGLDSLSHENPE